MGAFVRGDALHRLGRDRFDVLVIGGGVTGAGCALDAASRGLETALIERDDFASGTSSRSSKMVHGGLRYLQHGDVRLVYEALAERQNLLNNAPHLVEIVPFILPVIRGGGGAVPRGLAPALDLAMWAYDLTGGIRIGRIHERLSREETLRHLPTVRGDRLDASFLYYDAQVDDARLTLAVLRTAAIRFDAVVANRVEATSFTFDDAGQLSGVTARQTIGDDQQQTEFRISAKSVINATGVWADEVERLADPSHVNALRPAKGVHLTVPLSRVKVDVAAIFQARSDRRWVFVIPWGEHCFIGTTDTDYLGPLDDPRCSPDDVSYLLGAVNAEAGTDLTEADITGSWAGLRPLATDGSTGSRQLRSADLSRRHRVEVEPNGVVTVTGGKLTTYRRMAADTLDALISANRAVGSIGGIRRRSVTRKIRLTGATGYRDLVASGADPRLVKRYGSEVHTILAMIRRDPSLAEPVVDGLPYTRAEFVFAARYEMALDLDDLFTRRTRARILDNNATSVAAPRAAEVVAQELNWNHEDMDSQVEAYRRLTAGDFTGPNRQRTIGATQP